MGEPACLLSPLCGYVHTYARTSYGLVRAPPPCIVVCEEQRRWWLVPWTCKARSFLGSCRYCTTRTEAHSYRPSWHSGKRWLRTGASSVRTWLSKTGPSWTRASTRGKRNGGRGRFCLQPAKRPPTLAPAPPSRRFQAQTRRPGAGDWPCQAGVRDRSRPSAFQFPSLRLLCATPQSCPA